jgi:hypothetical protein
VDNFDTRTEYIIAAYAYFERRLREICAERTGISGPLDAAEAWKLIRHHTPMTMPGNKLWGELMMLKKIRNVIVSSAGRLGERSLLTYAMKRGIVKEIGPVPYIHVTDEYKSSVRGNIVKFFEELHSLNTHSL